MEWGAESGDESLGTATKRRKNTDTGEGAATARSRKNVQCFGDISGMRTAAGPSRLFPKSPPIVPDIRPEGNGNRAGGRQESGPGTINRTINRNGRDTHLDRYQYKTFCASGVSMFSFVTKIMPVSMFFAILFPSSASTAALTPR